MLDNADGIRAEPHGLLYTWRRGDALPELASPAGLVIEPAGTNALPRIAAACGEPVSTLLERAGSGHQAWLATLDGQLAGWGWIATGRAFIGGLDIWLSLPAGERYLWDFTTLPAFRGRRIYPALLQAMLRSTLDATRFWIGHDAANEASRLGILRAGFSDAIAAHPTTTGSMVAVARGSDAIARAGAELLGMPLIAAGAEHSMRKPPRNMGNLP